MNDALTLSAILAREVAIEWHEAIAVVRAVTEPLVVHAETTPLLPELHQIRIGSDGRVEVLGGAAVQEPVRRLGQLLQAALVRSEPPVQLRLLISQATAPAPAYSTIREYDDALGYFERPGRADLIRALHARASQASAVPEIESRPMLDAIAPLPTREPAAQPRASKHPKVSRGAARLVALAAAIVLVCAAAALQITRSGPRPGARNVPAVAATIVGRLGDALLDGASFVTDRVGLGRLVSAGAEAAAAPLPAEAPDTKDRPRSRTRPFMAEAPDPAGAHVVVARRPVSKAVPTDPAAAASAPVVPARFAPFIAFDLEHRPTALQQNRLPDALTRRADPDALETAPEAIIHTQASEGVSPPIAVRPQLPRDLPPHVARSELRQIDLIISADGTVEEVKLLGRPRNVHDSMLLSAAKAWQFRPAVKNGVPVKYLKTVWIPPRQ